jgi:flagellar protein FliO/FliZ
MAPAVAARTPDADAVAGDSVAMTTDAVATASAIAARTTEAAVMAPAVAARTPDTAAVAGHSVAMAPGAAAVAGGIVAMAPDAAAMAPAPPAPELPSYGGLLLRTLLALAIVIALVWILLRWGLRRLTPGAAAGGRALRVVARQALDGRRSVVLVQAAGRYLLLGVAEGSVRLITELDTAQVDEALRESGSGAGAPRRFAEVLREKLGRAPKAPPSGGDSPGRSRKEPPGSSDSPGRPRREPPGGGQAPGRDGKGGRAP